ncbi:MAG: hypothetical protein HY606_08560 [Planctomycetes bacterium]|nr:hypothetical protein [Planctomycetota bacterium]
MSVADNLLKKAEFAFNKEQYEYAKELLAQVVTLTPDNIDARKLLYAATIKNAEKKHSKISLSFKGVKLSGELAVTRNPQKRAELAQHHLNEDPFNNKVRLILVKALVENGYLDGALVEASFIVEKDPKNADAYKQIGAIYLKKNMVEEAQKAFDVVKRLIPTDREIDKMIRDLAATTTLKKGFETARTYRDIIKDKDKQEELEKMQHLIKTKEDVLKVIEKFKAELKSSPDDVKIVKKIADFYFDYLKDYKSASEWYQKASGITPEDSIIKDKIDDCAVMQLGDRMNAATTPEEKKKFAVEKLKFEISSYERRVKDRPTDSQAHYELGRRYLVANLLDYAITEFQFAIKDPKYKVRSTLYLGICFQKKKIYDIAHRQFDAAEGICNNQELLLEIWYNKANCFADDENYEKAMDMHKKILQVNINYKDVSKKIADLQEKIKTLK